MFYLDAPPEPRRIGNEFRCVFPPEPTLDETSWTLCTFCVVQGRDVRGKVYIGVTVIHKAYIDASEAARLAQLSGAG